MKTNLKKTKPNIKFNQLKIISNTMNLTLRSFFNSIVQFKPEVKKNHTKDVKT